MRPLADIERRLDALTGNSAQSVPGTESGNFGPAELLELGAEVLEHWVAAKGLEPTQELREGFRLLALHAQGTKGDPSFNACRETCRELVYHYNLLTMDPQHEESPRRLRMMALVANHLRLFVVGKLQVAGLGDFCCSSRPAREQAARVEPA
ncbi:MAG TPA: hypothetical protein PK163_08820 [Steroidobacteraceae bacterium]|nr:hypothetical protein [Steroidobacteraceae bacterium]